LATCGKRAAPSAVDFVKDDIERADDGGNAGQHMSRHGKSMA